MFFIQQYKSTFSKSQFCNCDQNYGQVVIDNNFINCCAKNGVVRICGNFVSTINKPAITIEYDSHMDVELIIENSKIEGVASYSYFTNLSEPASSMHDMIVFNVPKYFQYNGSYKITIRNCLIMGNYTNVDSKKSKPRVISVSYPKKFYFLNNLVKGTAGINIAGWDRDFEISSVGQSLLNTADIKVMYNKILDTDGRLSNGKNGWHGSGSTLSGIGASAISISCLNGVSGVEIAWNEIVNIPDSSLVEDVVNFYLSSGTKQSPIKFHDNYIQGTYPYPCTFNGDFSGG